MNPRRRPLGCRSEHRNPLRATLAADGTGVALLFVIAAATSKQHWRPQRTHELLATAIIGGVGWMLAAVAVGTVTRGQGKSGTERFRRARQLIVAGFILNTVGCGAVIIRFRSVRAPLQAATAMLVGGTVLSSLYYRQISTPESPRMRHPRSSECGSPPPAHHRG
jgi:hypothetical protein